MDLETGAVYTENGTGAAVYRNGDMTRRPELYTGAIDRNRAGARDKGYRQKTGQEQDTCTVHRNWDCHGGQELET